MRTFCPFMFCHYKKKSLHVNQNQSVAKPKLFDWLEIMSYPEINPEIHPELLKTLIYTTLHNTLFVLRSETDVL